MTGNNEFRLNTATMKEALQMYFSSRFNEPIPIVTDVSEDKSSYGTTFTVKTTDKVEGA